MSDATQSFPHLSFTDQDVREAAAREQIVLGWYYFLCAQAIRKVASTGSCMISLGLKPCERAGDGTSAVRPNLYANLVLPMVNPDVAGHKKPNTGFMLKQILPAFFGDELPQPVKDGAIWTYEGKEVSGKKLDAARVKAMTAVYDKALSLWEDNVEEIVGCGCYAEVKENADKEDPTKVYRNAENFCIELPAGAQLVEVGHFVEKVIDIDDEEAEEKPVAKTAKATAPLAAKKNGKR